MAFRFFSPVPVFIFCLLLFFCFHALPWFENGRPHRKLRLLICSRTRGRRTGKERYRQLEERLFPRPRLSSENRVRNWMYVRFSTRWAMNVHRAHVVVCVETSCSNKVFKQCWTRHSHAIPSVCIFALFFSNLRALVLFVGKPNCQTKG